MGLRLGPVLLLFFCSYFLFFSPTFKLWFLCLTVVHVPPPATKPDVFHLATFNSSLDLGGFHDWSGDFSILKLILLACFLSLQKRSQEGFTNVIKPQIEVYKDHSFMLLPITVSLGHFSKARSDTCPQGPASFPGWGWQRIPQIKVKLWGGWVWEGDAQEKTVSRNVAGLTSFVGIESKMAKAENIVVLLGKLCFRESMYLIKYGFSSNIQFSSLHIPDT